MPRRLSRRQFIGTAAAAVGAGIVGATQLTGGRPRGRPEGLEPAGPPVLTPPGTVVDSTLPPRPTGSDDHLLVVLEMPGGNDGPSMAVPYGVGAYYDMRPSTAVPAEQVLRIDDEIGLHPNLVNLHRRGVTLVEGVGSFEPDGSHFEMMSQWWAGNPSGLNSETGWVGRLADVLQTDSTPIQALSVGFGNHPIVRSAKHAALAFSGPDGLSILTGAPYDYTEAVLFQNALRSMSSRSGGSGVSGDIRSTLNATLDFADRLIGNRPLDGDEILARRDRFGYSDSYLADSLWFAAEVLGRDIGIRVIHVTMDATFDTHIEHNRWTLESTTDIDTNVEAFRRDLEDRKLAERTMVMTMSEFGRTPGDNGSGGLDHGTASTLFVIGPGTGRRVGRMPSFTDLDENGDFKANVRFESYLAGVTEGWLGVPAAEVFVDVEPLAIF